MVKEIWELEEPLGGNCGEPLSLEIPDSHPTGAPCLLQWNEVVHSFRGGMPRGKHRRHMRTHDDCFGASEAASWLHRYLAGNQNFGPGVTRWVGCMPGPFSGPFSGPQGDSLSDRGPGGAFHFCSLPALPNAPDPRSLIGAVPSVMLPGTDWVCLPHPKRCSLDFCLTTSYECRAAILAVSQQSLIKKANACSSAGLSPA